MLTGGLVVVIWRNISAAVHPIFAVYELLPAFILSCLVILIVSLATKKPSKEIEREFEAARTMV